jgi:outer membrane receptor protein involved in Fe transport
LKTATIDNFDFRYEYYPRGGETVSVGAFYKNFTNPIENRTIVTTEQPTFSYINADKAFNYGVELELRKSLLGVTNYAFLNKLSVNVNFSYIISQVDLGETAVAQARVRALQGQSPYIFNSAISYNDEKNKLAVTAVYNIFGDRIFSVGDVIFPTIYELSRHSFDLTINKKVGERLTFKIGAQDLLNFPFRFFEDSDRNEKITSDDNPIVVYRRGSIVSFSMSYDLSRSQNK